MEAQLSTEQKLILLGTKVNHSEEELDKIKSLLLSVENWDVLYSLLTAKGLAPLYNKILTKPTILNIVPDKIVTDFKKVYFFTLSRNIKLTEAFKVIISTFQKNNISVIALKGIYLSEYLYKDIALRQFSDIDLLVNEGDANSCLDSLSLLGYKPVETYESEFIKSKVEIIHYSPMIKDDIAIELHIKLHKDGESYHLDNESLWKNAIPANINGIEVMALDKYDQLIHLCIHLDKHIKTGHVQFTCFMDIVNYLEKFKDDFDWSVFVDRCIVFNCINEVFTYVLICNKYMNAYLPDHIIRTYQKNLQRETEEHFLWYLTNNKKNKVLFGFSVNSHLHNLNSFSSWKDKVKYLKESTLPPKEFILKKYQPYMRLSGGGLRNIKFWRIWYVHRWYIGLKGVIRLIMKNIEQRIKSKE